MSSKFGERKQAKKLLYEAWDASDDSQLEYAIDLIDAAIQIVPTNWYLWASKAQFLEGLGKFNESEAAARRSLSLDKNQPLVWILLARANIREGDFENAIKCYRKSLAIEEDFGTLTMLAAVELEVNPNDALAHANRALELNPDWGEAKSIRMKAMSKLQY